MIAVINYINLICLGLVVLSVFAIADLLQKKGYVKTRLYTFDPLRHIEAAKRLYGEGDRNVRFWVRLLVISALILLPMSLCELILHFLVK